jgi:hypothetical protein
MLFMSARADFYSMKFYDTFVFHFVGCVGAFTASRWSEYVSLFQSQMFVHVSSIDLLILSLMVSRKLLS